MPPSILVTAATGNIGSLVVKELLARGETPRVLVRTSDKAGTLKEAGVEIAVGDFDKPETLREALHGIEKVFFLLNVPKRHSELTNNFIEAARQARIKLIVNLSMLGAEKDSAIGFARTAWQVEQQLNESGIPVTQLEPNLFMQNYFRNAASIANQGAFYLPMRDGKVATVDIRDIASVAAGILTGTGHEGQTYMITGPESLNYNQTASIISKVLDKEVKYVDVPFEAAKDGMLKAGLPEDYVNDLIELYRLFGTGYGAEVTDVVSKIGQKQPITFEQFVKDNISVFKG
jgi:uncharacterized protein YbjT (DUF2867 family)